MRRRDLLQMIASGARERGVEWRFVRHGGDHDLWSCGGSVVQVPRHRKLNEDTARGILVDLEQELGEHWWRR